MKCNGILVALLLALLASGCAAKAPEIDEQTAAAQVVQDFYKIHIPPGRYDRGNPRDYEAAPQIHPDLVARIQAAMNTEMGIGFDPFLCSQAWPQIWGVSGATVEGETAQVLLQTTYGETKVPVTVFLQKQAGQWKIISTSCFPD